MTDFRPVDLAAIKKREAQVLRIMGAGTLAIIAIVLTAAGLTVAGVL